VLCTFDPVGIPLGTDEVRPDVHRGIHFSNVVRVVVDDARSASAPDPKR